MLSKDIDINKESEDFNKIYSERFANMKGIMLDDNRVENYYYNNPWRYGFSRDYAFQQILSSFEKILPSETCRPLQILEIGCGNGWFSININKKNNYKFTSIDVSQVAINNARTYSQKNGVTNNEYICSAFETFDCHDEYDFVVCINSLHHFIDLEKFCNKCRNLLSKKGSIYIYDVCPDRFNINNATYVYLIELILSKTNNFYKECNYLNVKEALNRILDEWQSETESLKQSIHDHAHDTETILKCLRKNFIEKDYSEHGGILTRLLGGIRGPSIESLGKALIEVEKVLLEENMIAPYNYCFVGSKL